MILHLLYMYSCRLIYSQSIRIVDGFCHAVEQSCRAILWPWGIKLSTYTPVENLAAAKKGSTLLLQVLSIKWNKWKTLALHFWKISHLFSSYVCYVLQFEVTLTKTPKSHGYWNWVPNMSPSWRLGLKWHSTAWMPPHDITVMKWLK
jgi:hypothetical protein